MKVFVTGGSGFVGRTVIQQLVDKNHQVRALTHSALPLQHQTVEAVSGDVTRAESLSAIEGCDAVIHLVGIIREKRSQGITFERLHSLATQNVVKAAADFGVKRYIHMSANGAATDSETGYHKTKFAAEQFVRNSGLDWTIFRPSLIFGPDDLFVTMLTRLVKLLPLVPVFGSGDYRLQPVHVSDIANAFVAALERPDSIAQTFCCGGPEALSYTELLDRISQLSGLGPVVRKVRLPLAGITPLVSLLQHCPLFPITSEQLSMLTKGNTCPDNLWADVFNLKLKSLNSLR